MRTQLLCFILLTNSILLTIQAQLPCLHQQGMATQLMVDSKPFLILGGELGNSSAAAIDDCERIFPKLQRMNLNTVLVPAYWDLIEPTEGIYDFTLIDNAIEQARKNNLKLVFLWFGAWKNSMSCYAPLWFKDDEVKYPRVQTKSGRPLEIASAFSDHVFEADYRAFSQFMQHLAAVDKTHGTVLMIQIENEIGMLEEARDYSPEANALFATEVPAQLINYFQRNRKKLHPQMLEKWSKNGCKTKGTWAEIFGNDIYTDEIFMAWHYAQYVEKMAQTARSIHPIPLYVNAAMNSRNRQPGEYPSAGPLAHLIDIWHCAAPSIDILAPDLYDNNFTNWVAKYALPNNPLFIPEIRLHNNDGVRAFYVFGEYNAIGFSPFSIEDGSDAENSPLLQGYATLKDLMPIITVNQGKGTMNGLLFDNENKERILLHDDLKITCRHYFTLPWDARATDGSTWPEGGGIIIRLDKNEYLIAGSGMVVAFENKTGNTSMQNNLGEDGFANAGGETKRQEIWNGKTQIGIGFVDEIKINDDGTFKYVRRLNGDQSHQGRHVRIGVDDFKILHVKLYEY